MSDFVSTLKKIRDENKENKEIIPFPFRIRFSHNLQDKYRKYFNSLNFEIYPITISIISDSHVKFIAYAEINWEFDFKFSSKQKKWIGKNFVFQDYDYICYIK